MGGCATCRMVIELRPGLHPCKEDQETGPVRNHRTDRRITGHLAARGLRVECQPASNSDQLPASKIDQG